MRRLPPDRRRDSPGTRPREDSPTSTSGTSPTSIRARPRGAPRRTSSPPRLPTLRQFQGKLGVVGRRRWPTRSTRMSRLDKELSRLYVYASMLADQDTRDSEHAGHAAGDAAARRRVRRAGVVHRAGDPARSARRRIETFIAAGAAAQGLRVLPATTSSAARAHTLSDAEEKILADAGPLAGVAVEHLQHPVQRRLSRIRRSR